MGSYSFGFIGFLRVMGVEYESYWALCLFLYLALSQSFFQRHSLF
ncbi:YrvL family regulatory protein [Priestia megaterium]